MQKLPQPLQDVVEQMAGLPGLGPKSALRAALCLLHWPKERAIRLGESIRELRDLLHVCSRCGSLSETEVCSICSDPARNETELCLVSEWDSLLVMEEAGLYKGRYLVLGGLIAPLDGVDAKSLRFDILTNRLAEGEVIELILALGTTLDAEVTATHIVSLVRERFPHVTVSRLAQGIPLGADIKYVDKETLRQSVQYRQKL